MPIYEYECEKCAFKFELLRNFKEDGGALCPKCQGHSPRVFSRMSYIWKGARHESGKTGKNESKEPNENSEPKAQSVNKSENDKKKENGKNTENSKKNDE